MLSSDKNIETISQLIEMVKHNVELRKEYAKLDIVDKVVRLISAATLTLVIIVIVAAALLFASAAVAVWLSAYTGLALALLSVAGFYLLVLLVVYLSRKSWIERPLVKYLSRLLLN
ncbi:MAG: phage holin family protein [Prevotella sp.]|nr:phage holin family protein [Prevotella sp.]